jgi:hypothetical protein
MRLRNHRLYGILGVAGLGLLGACGGGDDGGDDAPPGQVAQRASRSGTIALTDDGALVLMVNPEDDSVSVFSTTDNLRTGKVPTGDEPSNVVVAANGTAYVANRADATVVKLDRLGEPVPSIIGTAAVGSEPIGLALSPSGATLFVAEFAESRVAVIDTATMTVTGAIAGPRNPRALLVTNDRDEEDADETLIVAEFFGVPDGPEGSDTSRDGVIRRYHLADLSPAGAIELDAVDSLFPKGGVAGGETVFASPNQLTAMATANGRLFITSVAASAAGPTRFDNNVFPVVYVANLETGLEEFAGDGTTNLARKIVDKIPAPTAERPRFIPGDLSDLDFVPDTEVAYAVGRAGDVMQRIIYGGERVEIGSSQNVQIDLAGDDARGKCQGPTGVVVLDTTRAFVNCWVSRRLGVVNLEEQALLTTVEASAAPTGVEATSAARGRRFYYTGRGRWSNAGGNGAKGGEGWSSCGSCHPDGLTDNITWSFGSGPRQTTSQDGSFSHGPGPQKRRIFNWTAINEEHHDFERNTRDVSGGLGAITTAATLADCNQLDKEIQVSLAVAGTPIAGVGKPLKVLADDPAVALCGHEDWDDIDTFVSTIRPRSRAAASCSSTAAAPSATAARAGPRRGATSCRARRPTPSSPPRRSPRRRRSRRRSRTTTPACRATRSRRSRRSRSPTGRGRPSPPRFRSRRSRACCATSARSAIPATPRRPTRSRSGSRTATPSGRRAAPATTCRPCTGSRSARRTSTTAWRRRSTTCSPIRAGTFTPTPASRTSR